RRRFVTGRKEKYGEDQHRGSGVRIEIVELDGGADEARQEHSGAGVARNGDSCGVADVRGCGRHETPLVGMSVPHRREGAICARELTCSVERTERRLSYACDAMGWCRLRWHIGQKCAERPCITLLRIGAPHRGQGWPVRP